MDGQMGLRRAVLGDFYGEGHGRVGQAGDLGAGLELAKRVRSGRPRTLFGRASRLKDVPFERDPAAP
jgi:hypothetical protein